MEGLPEEIVKEVVMIGEEVKQFITSPQSYYGVTLSGFMFDIIKCNGFTPEIADTDNHFTYLLAKCVKGTYLLRQQIFMGRVLEWYLEAEIVLPDKSEGSYLKLLQFLQDNPDALEKICGEPHPVKKNLTYDFMGGDLDSLEGEL